MKITLNREDDALYIRLDTTTPVVESEEVETGVVLDFDAGGRVIAIEVRALSERFPASERGSLDLETI